ncbi:MAG: DUF3341 domain-containing protein [Planctomycetes bacterium]|nr:DUF3341 domain-containing protein [Planctomycetota bacterium]
MSRLVIGVFADEDHVVDATRDCRLAGFEIQDVYTPYAVHGMDEAMGLRRSRLTWVCFAAGAAGCAFALWFQYYTQAVNWPINVGGKDPWQMPAYVPIAFELTVLIGGLTTMLALFVRSRLFPGKRAKLPAPGVTDDKFALVLLQRDSSFDAERARAILAQHHVERVLESGGLS